MCKLNAITNEPPCKVMKPLSRKSNLFIIRNHNKNFMSIQNYKFLFSAFFTESA